MSDLAKAAAYSGDPWIPKNQYFKDAEVAMKPLWERLIWPMIKDCDFRCTLDFAAGHGRNSEILKDLTEQLYISDIQPGNVKICEERFTICPQVSCFVGNGYDFSPLSDGSLSMVYCFDAMVHFEPEVVESYLRDTSRVLRPGGHGFFHHSNDGTSIDWKTNRGSRNRMTKALFADLAIAAGLKIVNQRVINWGKHENLDCLTLVRNPV